MSRTPARTAFLLGFLGFFAAPGGALPQTRFPDPGALPPRRGLRHAICNLRHRPADDLFKLLRQFSHHCDLPVSQDGTKIAQRAHDAVRRLKHDQRPGNPCDV